MKKEETLRGRGAFSSLYATGKRLEGKALRCYFRVESEAGTPLRAGFSISARQFNAVRRNRLRRLMRAAFDTQRDGLLEVVNARGCALVVVFIFTGRRRGGTERIGLTEVRLDMEALCERICAAVTSVPQ